ncbi:MAG: hypothetical protein BGO78_08085 [Chloroflexi bacterium 44-23]|nr:MAG: hypothetical protein BGO78_08085 [Chloroflexi bacterium 44-23]
MSLTSLARIIKRMRFSRFYKFLHRILPAVLIAVVLAVTIAWLNFAPSGLLGKMDAVGYAVCHRIDARSFHLGDRALPLCSRCSGMHLATFLSLAFQTLYGKRTKMPPKKILVVLGVFAAAFALDGINSYMHFFPNGIWLYEPQNWLRLLTGSGLGIGIAVVLYPIINQVFWKEWQDEAAIANWKTFFILVGLVALLDLALLSDNPIILYPLAVLSGLGVLVTLSLCYGMLIVMLIKRENAYKHWRSAWLPLLAGFLVAISQTYIIDFFRYLVTGTWGGFNL